jgi:hypothetical protein
MPISMPAASGWTTARLRSSLWILRIISPLLAVHVVPFALGRARDCFLGFFGSFLWLGSHTPLPTLNSTWLGPVGENYSISPAGSGPFLFQGMPATIYPIASTGAMLDIGQERSRENAALAAEPGCAADSTAPAHP